LNQIAMTDLRRQHESIAPLIDGAVSRVFDRGRFELGIEKRAFEKEFAAFCGVAHGIGVGNGTDALEITLRACGIGPGDEVITAPNSCLSTTAAISHSGARFVLADICEQTYNIDRDQIEDQITSATKAIVPVHMYGHPAEMDTINEVAHRHGLLVIEDAALAHGASYRGRRTGCLADAAIFSFAPPKILGACGDAGIILTDDESLAKRARMWSSYGEASDRHPSDAALTDGSDHLVEGRHSHLDEVQAAILRAKLPFLDEWVARRRHLAALYERHLCETDVVLPFEAPSVRHAYRNYTVRVADRGRLRRALAAEGIRSQTLYSPPIHLQTVYRDRGFQAGDYPVAERVSDDLVCLPIHPWLTDEQVQRTAEMVSKHVASYD
jgi:dTDP-4-amino-4,6-dideoxygalactose transaminase